jgi:hypothetical protein
VAVEGDGIVAVHARHLHVLRLFQRFWPRSPASDLPR